LKKGIVDDATCEICHALDESPAHIIFGCAAACSSRMRSGIQGYNIGYMASLEAHGDSVSKPYISQFGTSGPSCSYAASTFGNGGITESSGQKYRTHNSRGDLGDCKAEAFLWGARVPKADKEVVNTWCQVVANAM